MIWNFETAMPYAAHGLYARLRQDAGDEWSGYVEHRFVKEIADGSLDPKEFRAWMIQDYLYVIHYTRAYALLIYKSDTLAGMRDAAHIVYGLLTSEMSLHKQCIAGWDVSEEELQRESESLETLAYSRYVLDRAQTGDVLDLVVTLSACLAGYAEIGLRIAADPDTKLEGNPYRRWIETYSGDAYLGIVADGLKQLEAIGRSYGADARYPHLLKEFRMAVRLEASFWDAGRPG